LHVEEKKRKHMVSSISSNEVFLLFPELVVSAQKTNLGMDRRFTYVSIESYVLEIKSDLISYANGNPKNQSKGKLSRINRNFFGTKLTKLFVRRHHNELQRCSQFYSLASIFNETATKDKHNNVKKKYFRCFYFL
jgi:hypothetical protein